MEVAGARRPVRHSQGGGGWRCPFRYRGSRRRSAVAQLFSLGSIERIMPNENPVEQSCGRQISGLALIPLIFLPGILFILSLKYLDGPGMGDKYGAIWDYSYYGITAICSLATSLGIVRVLSLAGATKIVTIIILAPVLYCVSYFVTFFVMVMLFLPRC